MNSIPRWIPVVILLLAGVAVAEGVMIALIDSELDRQRGKVERLADQVTDYAYEGKPVARKGEAEPASDQRLKSLERQLRMAASRISALESGDVEGAELEDIVDRKFGEKMMAAVNAFRGRMKNKVPLSKLSEKLELTESQKLNAADSIKRSKVEIFELATSANENDKEFVAEVNDLLVRQMPRPRKVKLLREKLMSGSPPGTNASYLEELLRIRDEALDELSETLTPVQYERFRKMRVSPFNVRADR